MSGKIWTEPELKRLRQVYKQKPGWTTDLQYAALVAPQFKRSAESLRWQFRQFHEEQSSVKPPRILMLDIETAPMEFVGWSPYQNYIPMDNVQKDWSILCWSAKWLFESKTFGQAVMPHEAVNRTDASIMQSLWTLMNDADIVVTHNGDEFDIKKINARLFINGYTRPMYSKSIDTKKVAKANFSFSYNKLDWIAQLLGVGRKIETEFKWWLECIKGSQEYLSKMLKYNKQDTHLEEEVYLKLRPWMLNHPNMNLYANAVGNVCPTCGSNNLNPTGTYATALGLYQGFRCEDCGAIARSTKAQYKLSGAEVQ